MQKNKYRKITIGLSVLWIASFLILYVISGIRWFCNAWEGVYASPEITAYAVFLYTLLVLYFTPLLCCIAHYAKLAEMPRFAKVARVASCFFVFFSSCAVLAGVILMIAK